MNKPRRLAGGRQRQLLESLSVSSSDRRKGDPLVGNQAGFNASSLSPRQFSDCKQNTHRANRHFDHKYGPERGPGASGSQSVHCSPPAKFVFRVRTSATVCLSLPRKRLARLLAKSASAFAPAMALCPCRSFDCRRGSRRFPSKAKTSHLRCQRGDRSTAVPLAPSLPDSELPVRPAAQSAVKTRENVSWKSLLSYVKQDARKERTVNS